MILSGFLDLQIKLVESELGDGGGSWLYVSFIPEVTEFFCLHVTAGVVYQLPSNFLFSGDIW